MNELLDTLFKESKFEKKDTSEYVVYFDELNCRYWIVYDAPIENVIDNQDNIVSKIGKEIRDKSFDKNAYLLVLWKVPKVEEIDFKKITRIEENDYFLKKYVLYYEEKELLELKDNINDFSVIKKKCEELLASKEVFDKLKDRNCKWASLLYRLAIKTPLLNPVEPSTESKLESVESKIENAILNNSSLSVDLTEYIESTMQNNKDIDMDIVSQIYERNITK